ncbi:hypothetical protein DNH61_25280 [Paenibacillus sambharensis]|uniref:Major facilitator superfamily (MFS) profile domain-containing protein n=1 Tax=Paenibacillus sambharensis TaxID=1803190 RepID=A0A2W1LFA5_9BACL|nr:MFS transporter [Paenibacillus sambharensis]PZD93094.1 hypothetical protein DNH61_25280 [Paenibacillus sambharensis]
MINKQTVQARWLILIDFLYELNFFTLIFAVFLAESGLSLVTISLAFAVRSACKMLLEFPSGLLADRWGRKNIVMIGLGLSAAAYLLYIWIPPRLSLGSLSFIRSATA